MFLKVTFQEPKIFWEGKKNRITSRKLTLVRGFLQKLQNLFPGEYVVLKYLWWNSRQCEERCCLSLRTPGPLQIVCQGHSFPQIHHTWLQAEGRGEDESDFLNDCQTFNKSAHHRILISVNKIDPHFYNSPCKKYRKSRITK